MTVKGPWSQAEIDRFLDETRVPLRLSGIGGSGFPVLVSLWFRPEGGRLWCATQGAASIAKVLSKNPNCAFEAAPETAPYRGVRGQGVATLHPDRGAEVLRGLVDRYLDDPDSEFARWLLARADQETAIAIEPRTLVSWDYTERMGC